MTLSINKWLIVAILVGVGILMFALIRGCQNEKKAASLAIDYKGRINKLTQDSIDLANHLSASGDTINFLNEQSALSDNKLLSLNENLDKANDRISILLRKHVPIKPNPDTSVTLVPNIYIEECSDCFEELSNGRDSVKKYRAEKDNQEQIYKGKLSVKDNRINLLEKSNTKITKDYKSLIDSTGSIKRKGMLYFSYGVLWSAYLPKAVGAGFMYQDKRLRMYGVKGYFGSSKPMIETQVNMPLSFKKR